MSSLAAEREAARLASQHALLCGDLTAVAATFERPIFTWAGLAGDCVLLDALAACGLLRRVPVVFVDTLHLFPETLDFLAEVEKRYGFTALRYTPLGCPTRAEWRARWGSDLFITDMERYDSVAKVEPLQRALGELRADCWINGRRRDQGAERALLALVEPPPAAAAAAAAAGSSPPPPAKVNPLARWTFEDCFASAARTGAPTHPLHAQGYPSLGCVERERARVMGE